MDFLTDKNNSFHDDGFKNVLNSFKTADEFQRMKEMYKNLIIIRLKFMPPKDMSYIDVKYTLMDRVASFGGKFGIFAQLTGCSLLGLLSLTIVILKLLFSFEQNLC